jgi:hypothetical protein
VYLLMVTVKSDLRWGGEHPFQFQLQTSRRIEFSYRFPNFDISLTLKISDY